MNLTSKEKQVFEPFILLLMDGMGAVRHDCLNEKENVVVVVGCKRHPLTMSAVHFIQSYAWTPSSLFYCTGRQCMQKKRDNQFLALLSFTFFRVTEACLCLEKSQGLFLFR